MYHTGEGVAKDLAQAARLFRLAADQGHADGQYLLGVMYVEGKGVAKDLTEAVRLFRLAADQGLAEGQYRLGAMYLAGKGVAKDEVEGARLYRLAADQGLAQARDALAQNSFGRPHRKGVPVPKEAATPKVPASLYMLISGQVQWVALLSTLLCGVALIGWRLARRDVTDRPGRPRPSRHAHALQRQARETQHAAQHGVQLAVHDLQFVQLLNRVSIPESRNTSDPTKSNAVERTVDSEPPVRCARTTHTARRASAAGGSSLAYP
jgi:hypothetical protein